MVLVQSFSGATLKKSIYGKTVLETQSLNMNRVEKVNIGEENRPIKISNDFNTHESRYDNIATFTILGKRVKSKSNQDLKWSKWIISHVAAFKI